MNSKIGGQAVIEGVMMRNGAEYAVSVRKPDGNIETKKEKAGKERTGILKAPVIRGVVAFIDSLVIGIKTLTYSASFFEEDEKDKKEEKKGNDNLLIGGTVALSIVLGVAIFMLLPWFLSNLIGRSISNPYLVAVIEGALRLLIFIVYIVAISQMNDIKRVFMYHGAEHKSINCIENGEDLTVENVRKQSRCHKRCGTSFLFFVIFISIIVFMFIRVDNHLLQMVLRLLLVPVIAGVSYEIIRFFGNSENKIAVALSKPGFMFQNLTTREPDDDMIEVAIASVEAVFDWRSFVGKVRKENEKARKAALAAAAKAEKEAKEKAEKLAKEAAERAEKAEKEAAERAEKAEKEAAEKAEKAAKEAKEKAEREAKAAAEKAEKAEKEAAEKAEKAAKEAAEKAEREAKAAAEKLEREAKAAEEKAAREAKAAAERAERAAREEAEEIARKEAEAAKQAALEEEEKEAALLAEKFRKAKEQAEKEAGEKAKAAEEAVNATEEQQVVARPSKDNSLSSLDKVLFVKKDTKPAREFIDPLATKKVKHVEPVPSDEEEDDDVLKALDKFFDFKDKNE